MERDEYVQKRRRKYLAQVLDFFDERIAPSLNGADPEVVDEFRGLCRAKFNALAVDATDVMNLEGYVNAYADQVKDDLHADGRTATTRS